MPGPGAAVGIVFVGAAVVAVAVLLLSGAFASDDAGTSASVRRQLAVPTASADEARARPHRDRIAVVTETTALRSSPGGRRIGRLSPKTEFKSARVVAVVGQREGWLRVITSELRNGKRGWIDARDADLGVTRYRMTADVSARRIDVRRDGRVVRRIRTAVGEQGTPTPKGRFAVTDRVRFTDAGSPYGCCALALSAHQPHIKPQWSGGDRVAIHATPATDSIGRPVTLGCMRVPAADARWLVSHLPLGTQVTIRA